MKYKNLIELKEQRPQLYKRLVNWGLKRKNTWGIPYHKHKESVEAEINYYLDELVFTPTTFSQAYSNLTKWDSVLTDKEKQAVGLLFSFELPYETYKEKNKLQKLIDLGKHTLNWVGITIPNEVTLVNNWYDGLYKVLDEPILDKLTYGSEDIGLITENSYNAVILNTDNILIIDIDTYDSECSIVKYPEQAISALHILEEKENINFRIYQTAKGLRAIETTKEWNPRNAKKIMQSVYADPLYIGLCQSQECFRARLTPKPWRLPFDTFDYDNYVDGKKWMTANELSKVAVCKLITEGYKPIDDKFKKAISYHDRVTKALESKDLILV